VETPERLGEQRSRLAPQVAEREQLIINREQREITFTRLWAEHLLLRRERYRVCQRCESVVSAANARTAYDPLPAFVPATEGDDRRLENALAARRS
jgi:hypothetical protein